MRKFLWGGEQEGGGGREVFFQSEKIVINVKTFRPCGRPIIGARRRFTTDSKTYPDSIFAVFINNNHPAICTVPYSTRYSGEKERKVESDWWKVFMWNNSNRLSFYCIETFSLDLAEILIETDKVGISPTLLWPDFSLGNSKL